MYTIDYTGCDGSFWSLDGPQAGLQGAFVSKVSGLVGSRSRASIPGAGRVGVVRTGSPTSPLIEGTLSAVLSVRQAKGLSLPQVVREFRRAWSTDLDGALGITSSEGLRLHMKVHLDGPLPELEASPFDGSVAWIEMDVDVQSDWGAWLGPSVEYSGTNQRLVNEGEIEAWPVIEYIGSPTVTAGGVSITLPSSTSVARFDTDPGKGGVITVDGVPSPALWSQLRGRTFPLPVPVNGSSVWSFGAGAKAIVTPRFLDPWRW